PRFADHPGPGSFPVSRRRQGRPSPPEFLSPPGRAVDIDSRSGGVTAEQSPHFRSFAEGTEGPIEPVGIGASLLSTALGFRASLTAQGLPHWRSPKSAGEKTHVPACFDLSERADHPLAGVVVRGPRGRSRARGPAGGPPERRARPGAAPGTD